MYDNVIKPEDVIITTYITTYLGYKRHTCTASLLHTPTGITATLVGDTFKEVVIPAHMELYQQVLLYEEDLCWQEYKPNKA